MAQSILEQYNSITADILNNLFASGYLTFSEDLDQLHTCPKLRETSARKGTLQGTHKRRSKRLQAEPQRQHPVTPLFPQEPLPDAFTRLDRATGGKNNKLPA